MRRLAAVTICGAAIVLASPAPAAGNALSTICGVTNLAFGLAGKLCSAGEHAGSLLGAGKKLLTGHLGSAAKALAGNAPTAARAIGLVAVGAWVLGGAKAALSATAKVVSATTRPQLTSTWFSATYWRLAGIAALLTLPFLFAACVQALAQSDLALLLRAALGYLPLSLLAVSIAAPLTMLLLSACDAMCAVVSAAAGGGGATFLDKAAGALGAVTVAAKSPFLAFLLGLFTAVAALVLWIELAMREAAVYVVVLMLPLAFVAFVWPARRAWTTRAVELLVALILSKFAIVAVLALGGAGLGAGALSDPAGMVAGGVLVALATFAPWALVRMVPLAEVASSAAGGLRHESWARMRSAWGGSDRVARQLDAIAEDRDHGEQEGTRGAHAERERLDRLPALPAPSTPRVPEPAAASGSEPEPEPAAASGSGPEPGPESEPEPAPPPERSPGLDPIWQMDDDSWPPTILDGDAWPPKPPLP